MTLFLYWDSQKRLLQQLLSPCCYLVLRAGFCSFRRHLFSVPLQGCPVKQHLKLNYQKQVCFLFPKRTGVGWGGWVRGYITLKQLWASKDHAAAIMKINLFFYRISLKLNLPQKHVCEHFVQVAIILVSVLSMLLSLACNFSSKILVLSFRKVLLKSFTISYQLITPKIQQLVCLIYCNIIIFCVGVSKSSPNGRFIFINL